MDLGDNHVHDCKCWSEWSRCVLQCTATHMGDESEMDSISNKAFAAGYLGGGILLVVHLGMVLSLDGGWVIPFVMAPLDCGG